MRTTSRLLALAASLAIGAMPAAAVAAGNGHGPHPAHPSHPGGGTANQGKAYGKLCQGESKTHVKGEKGTPFSRCVSDMAKLAQQQSSSQSTSMPGPQSSQQSKAKAYGKVCQNESKKHVKGQKGTPFSQCVNAAARLAQSQRQGNSSGQTS